LKYLHSHGCSIESTAVAAADAGHWDCLEYAVRRGALLRGETLRPLRMPLAQRLARAGQLKLFPFALSREGEIDAQTTLNFAKTENWELFQLCIQYITQPNLDILTIVVRKRISSLLTATAPDLRFEGRNQRAKRRGHQALQPKFCRSLALGSKSPTVGVCALSHYPRMSDEQVSHNTSCAGGPARTLSSCDRPWLWSVSASGMPVRQGRECRMSSACARSWV